MQREGEREWWEEVSVPGFVLGGRAWKRGPTGASPSPPSRRGAEFPHFLTWCFRNCHSIRYVMGATVFGMQMRLL